jgi:hypothetical protein
VSAIALIAPPRRLSSEKYLFIFPADFVRRWLWIPAFAGTTMACAATFQF